MAREGDTHIHNYGDQYHGGQRVVSKGSHANITYNENALDVKIAALIEELRKHNVAGKEELVQQLQDDEVKQDKAKLSAVAGKVIQTAAGIGSIVSAAAALLS